MKNITFFLIIFLFISASKLGAAENLWKELYAPLLESEVIELKQESIIVENLKTLIDSTIKEIDSITPFTFKNRDDINAMNAAVLIQEAESIKSSLRSSHLNNALNKLEQQSESPFRAVLWCLVIGELISLQDNLDDMVRFGLIKNDDLLMVIKIASHRIMDKIIIPRTAVLAIEVDSLQKNKSEKPSK